VGICVINVYSYIDYVLILVLHYIVLFLVIVVLMIYVFSALPVNVLIGEMGNMYLCAVGLFLVLVFLVVLAGSVCYMVFADVYVFSFLIDVRIWFYMLVGDLILI